MYHFIQFRGMLPTDVRRTQVLQGQKEFIMRRVFGNSVRHAAKCNTQHESADIHVHVGFEFVLSLSVMTETSRSVPAKHHIHARALFLSFPALALYFA
jgi:hypothetical protein